MTAHKTTMNNEFHLGDCIEVLANMESETIDLTVTSPPYDAIRNYSGKRAPVIDYKIVAKELYRVTKPGGVCVWVVNDQTIKGSESLSSFRQAINFVDAGWRLHDTMIWRKDTATMPDKTRYNQVFEYMFIFSKGKPKTFQPLNDRPNKWAGTKIHGTYRGADGVAVKRGAEWSSKIIPEFGKRDNVWDIPGEKKNKTGHPAVFPERLVSDHIQTWSQRDDVVLDPFAGSGTTGVAAVKGGRSFVGIEISPDYYEIMTGRVQSCSCTEQRTTEQAQEGGNK